MRPARPLIRLGGYTGRFQSSLGAKSKCWCCPTLSRINKQGFFQQFWEKTPVQNWEKMIDFTSKLGEINDMDHNISSKSSNFRLYYVKHTTYAQVLKYHSDIGHCFS